MSPRSADSRRQALQRGHGAEGLVGRELITRGWTIVDRNWRGGGGELDLVVCKGRILRFVEVKQRSEGALTGLDSITPSKQRKLRRAAEAYLARLPEPPDEAAFLVVLVGEGDEPTMEWVDDAF